MSTTPLVRCERNGNVLVVSPLFKFGNYSAADLQSEWSALEELLHHESVRHVAFDLSEIPYFGSTVLEWMVLVWKRIRARGGQFVVCNCSEMGREILTVARFHTLWKICDDRTVAIATLTPAGEISTAIA